MEAIQKELDKLAKRIPALLAPAGYNPALPSAATLKLASAKGKDPSANVFHSLDRLIAKFEEAQSVLEPYAPSAAAAAAGEDEQMASASAPVTAAGGPAPDPAIVLAELRAEVELLQRSVNERQKEMYNALIKYGKALDKKFPTNVATLSDPRLFASTHVLRDVVQQHFLHSGDFDLAERLAEVSGTRRVC